MTEMFLVILASFLVAVVVILLAAVSCLYDEIRKLRKDNKFLCRVLEDYYRLEDGSKRAAQAINRKAGRSSQFPHDWRLQGQKMPNVKMLL